MKLQRIQNVQEPSHKKYKSKKKSKKSFLWLKSLLITLLLATTLVYGALSPFFNIKNVQVKETAMHYDNQTLISGSGIYPGVNGFRLLFDNPGKFYFLRIGSAEKAIMESYPYIKSVKVRFVLPSTVSIAVREREAAAILITDGTSLLIDSEEVLLEVDPDMKKLHLPVIKVKKPDVLKLGKKLDLQENQLAAAYKIYDAVREMDSQYQDKLMPVIDFVDVTDSGNVGFSLQSRVIVNLGELDDLVYKLNAVKTVFEKNIKKDDRGKLDFTTDGNSVFTPENGG
jgi:cell division septal protein FtsQ